MKVLCFIDCLAAGGAQRQLTTLAVGLKRRGHEIRFLVYHPHDHFLPLLQKEGISCQIIPACSYWERALAVRRVLRRGWQDVVLAFLEAPCLYAELARIPGQRWGLVAGERLAKPGMKRGIGRWIRQFHRFADSVITNSHTNRLMLEAYFPFIKNKLVAIYNATDLKLFHSSSTTPANNVGLTVFRIVVAANFFKKKNLEGVAKAMLQLKKDSTLREIIIDWYGPIPPDPTPYNQAKRFIVENGLGDIIHLHPPIRDIGQEFASASAVGLFSFVEGLPNAICEGMACGKPIILSDVCDSGSLVRDGKNGFLCDPSLPESIASAIQRLAKLSDQERQRMGLESRRMAEELFDENVIIDRYEQILEAAARHEPMPNNCAWPAKVPTSATRTVEQWIGGKQGRGGCQNAIG